MPRKQVQFDQLRDFLTGKAWQYNSTSFIESDPISVPHRFSCRQDIEIAGFFAATLAWGQRATIIKKCNELLAMMENRPYEFLRHHKPNDLKPFTQFKHRTFNATDTLYFIESLSVFYRTHASLEDAFVQNLDLHKPAEAGNFPIEQALIQFNKAFFSLPGVPARTHKHVSTPARKSACKRLNMFLRWMVRKDSQGVDFGIWNRISPSQLVCPCDVHVERVARKLKLITRTGMNWQTATELTSNLRKLDPADPVLYDFALFGLGVMERYHAVTKSFK
ncbi:MAG: TIGR02757 family protein [Cyclobacteriaceae bacterium]|nr:TIGR02757 family protein [Cyclobacteriaceae bacterium]